MENQKQITNCSKIDPPRIPWAFGWPAKLLSISVSFFFISLQARWEEYETRLKVIDSYLGKRNSGESIKEEDGEDSAMRERAPTEKEEQEEQSTFAQVAQNKNNDGSTEDEVKAMLYDAFKELCQLDGEYQSSIVASTERCMLYDPTIGTGGISPLKLEFHSYDPLIVSFHDVLDDDTIERLVENAESNLEEPKSFSSRTGNVQVTEGRTGKVSFLPNDVESLQKLSAAITGLSMEHSESLQIVSYGIGGHYEPHVDYFNINNGSSGIPMFSSADGDRVATLLYYLNDVTAGGATVFPRLGLTIKPTKGSALFWYNLYQNGVGDPFTLHAGCPVLLGQKRIANQWFRERGQEHLRKCALDPEL